MPTTDPKDFLPLSDLHYQVLLSLGLGSAHGYAIGREVEERTDGRVTATTGGLYQALRRLERNGLIARVDPPDSETDARRIYLAVTDLGRAVAAAESERLSALLDLAIERSLHRA